MRTRRTITMVGCHAEGEIGDVVTGGILPPAGATMYERMRTMEREHDDIRRFLLCEPRGHVGRHAVGVLRVGGGGDEVVGVPALLHENEVVLHGLLGHRAIVGKHDAQLLALCAQNTKEGANSDIVEKAQSQ